MENIITTTRKGCEGCNISYSAEQSCGKKLLQVLPTGWTVSFTWCQILFSDVQFEIDKEKKRVDIGYNQNLHYWWADVTKDILSKIS